MGGAKKRTDRVVVALKQRRVRLPVMPVVKAPHQNTLHQRVREIQRHSVVVAVSSDVTVDSFDVKLGDPDWQAECCQTVKASLRTRENTRHSGVCSMVLIFFKGLQNQVRYKTQERTSMTGKFSS